MSPRASQTAHRYDTADLESHRRELTGYCYRMLGSGFEADDAVQDTMVRAWRSLDRFDGRSSLRTWLYRIATNVCLDQLNGRARRARPMDLGPASSADTPVGPLITDNLWVQPVHDRAVLSESADPAEVAATRESIRLAFVSALQLLPPRQRAVLILREVLRWQAGEVAELLGTSVASVNSALQRARATIDSHAHEERPTEAMSPEQQILLDRYVEAFQRYDMKALTSLLHADAVQTMPPYELWLSGRDHILEFWQGQGHGCRGSLLLPTTANGLPAFGQYRPSGTPGRYEPWALQLLTIAGGQIVEFSFFLNAAELFPSFGLPLDPNLRAAASVPMSSSGPDGQPS
ncbi:sigma-70 family RNA polymerase sigma factor [Jatrophihabitans telluris]|uniref:sigma-70 family RNA polymerase sigma factor n=1 Tax=Jatrophihabitans telluris TaxID=2038343 RepID=UPI00322186F5